MRVPPRESDRRDRRVVGVLALLSGLFLVLLYAGVIPWRPPVRCRAVFCDPYHWQILCFGAGFGGMGVAILASSRSPAVVRAIALASGALLLAALAGSFTFRG